MDRQWHQLMIKATDNGERRADRTGVGTRALFGMQCRFDLREGFPACTTKLLGFNQVKAELASFLAGAESLDDFHRMGCTIWDANAQDPRWVQRARFMGDVGRIYGVQWRRWRSALVEGRSVDMGYNYRETDQIADLVEGLRRDPHGRRHLVTTWNPGELDAMCLPPCHTGFQCFASDDGKNPHVPEVSQGSLDLHFHMRSLDLFLGMPFDVACYALLCHLLGKATQRRPRWLIMSVGDAHVYNNHAEQVATVLAREPRRLPQLLLSAAAVGPVGFLPSDAELRNYDPHSAVPAPMNL